VGEETWISSCDREKLKLKAIILHDGIGKEVHMTQPVWFVAEGLIPVV